METQLGAEFWQSEHNYQTGELVLGDALYSRTAVAPPGDQVIGEIAEMKQTYRDMIGKFQYFN